MLYWPVSILLILKDQLSIICDPTLDIDEVPKASKQELIIPTSDHDHLEFGGPEPALS